MQIIEDPGKMQALARDLRHKSKRIALIPTSGALHAGHSVQIEAARKAADVVVVSAIVNPLEFGPNEDFQRFPRNSSADADFCEQSGVDYLFQPSSKDLYPEGFSLAVTEERISNTLCGVSRTHYFRGVCTLHTILFNLVRPDVVALSMRDPQRSVVVRKLISELRFPIETIILDTVRDETGLAWSARNAYLNEFQRGDAATLYKALQEGKRLADSGITNVDRILAEVTHHISQVRRLRVIYVAAVDPDTMEPVRADISPGNTIVMAAIWCDEVRLIDNILL